MNQRNHACWRVALTALALALGSIPQPGRAQPVVTGQGFKFTEYYDAPHETQLKAMLEGAKAERQPDGRVRLTDAKYRTFRETGEGEMAVEAPQCTYDPAQRSISSPGPLRVQTENGKFSIEGEGFLWQQTNATLEVSNRVHTTIHPELLSPQATTTRTNPPTAGAPGIEIFSDQFEFAQNSGRGIYQGNVRVAGTNLTSTAGRLTILLPAAERRLKTLTAEEKVNIDYVTPDHQRIQATGERAYYSADTGLFQMSGQPTWRTGQREGSGDELVFDRTNKVFQANGHARLKVPSQSLGSSGLLARPEPAAATRLPPTNQFVEILCDSYELRTNRAVFREQVRVSDRLGGELQGQMTCSRMTLTFAGTNELQKMVAEHQVVIAQGDKEFRAEQADYTGASGVLELTGDPRWRAGPREGKGDRIRANLAREEMLVRGNAFMRLPAAELGQSAMSAMGKPKAGERKGATNEFAEVFSKEYFLTPDSALFRGQVRIADPHMNWACDEVTMLTPPELGKAGRVIIAEPAVIFDLTDDQGRSFHGTGDKAVYTHRQTSALTNDLVVLTGTPAMLEATNLVGRNKIINLDLASHTLTAPGRYSLWGAAPPASATGFGPPKARSLE